MAARNTPYELASLFPLYVKQESTANKICLVESGFRNKTSRRQHPSTKAWASASKIWAALPRGSRQAAAEVSGAQYRISQAHRARRIDDSSAGGARGG
jgi:hypothetical protein